MFLVYKEKFCLGGTILYITEQVVHTQYIGINDEGKEIGALDLLTDYLINTFATSHNYFSFGISTEQGGQYLNSGLIQKKESFGGMGVVHDFYSIDLHTFK
jgi:hypothetical protein